MMWFRFGLYSSFIWSVICLFEDQVGKFDWRQQYIGAVKFGRFESSDKSLPRRFFVATEQNVLASLNFVTGDLIWRQVYETGNRGRIDDIIVRKDDIVSVSGTDHKFVRSFDGGRGNLRWEWSSYDHKSCSNSKLLELGGKVLAVLTCGRIVALDNLGNAIWTANLKQENVDWFDLVHLSSSANIIVAGKTADITTHLVKIDAKNGDILIQKQFSDVAHFDKCGLFAGSLNYLCVESSTGLVRTISLNEFIESTTSLSSFSQPVEKFIKLDSSAFALIDVASVARIYSLNADGGLTELIEPIKNVLVANSIKFEDKRYYVLAICDDTCEVRWIDGADGRQVTQANIFLGKTSEINGVAEVFPLVFSKIDRTTGFRAVVVGSDHSLSAIQPSGKPFWIRQEALASIVSVEMLDLPLSEAQASVESEFSTDGKSFLNMFLQRITSQARQIQRGFVRVLNESFVLLSNVGSSSDWLSLAKSVTHETDNAPLERDYFNLHKLIVVVSSVGKVFGLDSRRGKIVWQFFDKEIEPFLSADKTVLPLFVQRTTAHYPFPAQCVIIGRQKNSGFGRLLFFDPIAGKILKITSLKSQIKQAAPLPFATTEEITGFILLTTEEKTLIFPKEISQNLKDNLKKKPFYLFTADYSTGVCEGYRLDREISVDSEQSALVCSSEKVWKFVLPVDKGGKIVDIVVKRQHEHVHSQGRVLGDRSVLYKYSNPNLVAAAIQNVDDSGKSSLSIYLFDAVTGATVSSLIQRRVAPPFHLVHCENWLVYSFWNEKSRRTEFTVLELYEGKSQTDPDKFSSYISRPTPMVMRQAYVFPHGVNALAVTDTEKGITTRHLLVALPFGGILELHKAFLDPRRVLMPTPEEREEGLIPYMPDLPIATEHLINYNQSVINIRSIHTAPAGLESTSLVLAYGLDLFYTRVNPSATFDILKDDFDHWFISLMLLGLFLASYLTKRLARHRDLKLAWK